MRTHPTLPIPIRPAIPALLGLAVAVATTLPGSVAAEDSPPDISGRWAQKVVLTSVVDLPLIGQITSTTTSYLTVDTDQDDRRVTWAPTTCDITLDSNSSAVDTVLPDRFVEAVPTPERTGRIEEADDESRLTIQEAVTLMGAELEDPADDPLPTSPDAPEVTDDDGDGRPGVSVKLEGLLGGWLYVVRRSRDSYSGTITPGGSIRGLVDWKTEQNVLESTNPLLSDGPTPEPYPDPEYSWFVMQRVSESVDCEDVLSRKDELFE